MLATAPPFAFYPDTNGTPLDNGSVYFGVANGNPETSPITVYWDAAGTQPASQPIKTYGGLLYRNGTPATVYASGDYSMTVRNKAGASVYYVASSASVSNDSGLQAQIDTLKSTQGPGQIGFDYSASYSTGTLGKLLQGLAVNVKAAPYNAKCDGSTDDTAAVNAALAANSLVYIPPGTCIVSSLSVPSGVTVFGAGSATIIKQKVASQFNHVFNCATRNGITIRDLTIDGNGNAQPSGEHMHGINLQDAQDCKVLNVTVHDCNGDCIYIASTTNSILTQRILVEGCTVYNLGRQGICVAEYGARKIKIVNNDGRVGTYVTTSTSHGNPIHLEIDTQPSVYVGDVTIQGNQISEAGITVGGNFSNLSIIGNTVRGSSVPTTGLFGLIALISPFEVTISGNVLVGDGVTALSGIYIQDAGASGAASVYNIVVTGNSIDKTGSHGIQFIGTAPGVPSLGRVIVSSNTVTSSVGNGIFFATPFPNIEVLDNIIDGTTSAGLGIQIQGCQNFLVGNNRIREFAGSYGIYLCTNSGVGAGPGQVFSNTITHSTPAGKAGVRVENEATNTRIVIRDNDLAGVATGTAIGASAVKCFAADNIVGNDALTGTFTMAAAASMVITNANTLAGAQITLIPTNAAAAVLMGSAKFLYATATTPGTSFTVQTANAAAAAGTETFAYRISA
jgi:hypothetical protein